MNSTEVRDLILSTYRFINPELYDEGRKGIAESTNDELLPILDRVSTDATHITKDEGSGVKIINVVGDGDEVILQLVFQGGMPVVKYFLDHPKVNDKLSVYSPSLDTKTVGGLETILAWWEPVIARFGEEALP